jgi:uncharacterized peroxidase-related enzyme
VMYLEPVPLDTPSEPVRAMYDEDIADAGWVATDTQLFSLAPEVYDGWRVLQRSVRKTMRLRRYELLTIVAARALGCRACVSGHADACIRHGVATAAEIEAIVSDFRAAGLEPVEVALMDLVEKVATDAHRVTAEDVAALRAFGLADRDILAAVLVAAARSFYSKTLEALGVPPSPQLTATNGLLDLAGLSAVSAFSAVSPGDRPPRAGCA